MPRSLADAAADAWTDRQADDEAERQALAGQVRTEIRSALAATFPDIAWGTITIDTPVHATATVDGLHLHFTRVPSPLSWQVEVEGVTEGDDSTLYLVPDLAELGRLIDAGLVTPTTPTLATPKPRSRKKS